MNQTNFGFNPQRQTIVSPGGAEPLIVEPLSSGRGNLNTQKRNRAQTIGEPRTNSLNFQDLYSHYAGAPSNRVGNHVPGQKQLFLPGAMKMKNGGQRKAAVTQHQ